MKNDYKREYFEALSDLLLESIRTKQSNQSKTLSDFFYSAFKNIRDQFDNEPVIYPESYYETVYKAIEELAIQREKRNYLLGHRTSGSIWLLGELQGKEISDTTYRWIWRNLLLAVRYEQDDLVMNHWETAHQHYSYNLPGINKEYDYSGPTPRVINGNLVNKRINEQERFIEFHYALGGLLNYKRRYSCIKRMFDFTQSQPPKYELLPESMTEIFRFYFNIRDPYHEHYGRGIASRYHFPEISGLNSDSIVKKWIMSYMAILFLRQYTLIPYLSYMKPLGYPEIPKSQQEIKQWIDGVDFFKQLIMEHLKDIELLETLNLDFISREWCSQSKKPYPTDFIDTLKGLLEQRYHNNAIDLPLSVEKIAQFKESTKLIVESVFRSMMEISNKLSISEDDSDKWYINGQTMLQSKDAFTSNPEAHHLNFDSILASIISQKAINGVGETFIYKKSRTYLLKSEDLFKGLDKLGIDDSFIIINFGVNLDYISKTHNISKLSDSHYRKTKILTFDSSPLVRDSIFVLKESDLPKISSIDQKEETIRKYSLERISNSIDLYASVIDLNNADEEVFNENLQNNSAEELRKSLLLCLSVSIKVQWKKDVEVVQLKQYTEWLQQGIVNKLEDIKPFS